MLRPVCTGGETAIQLELQGDVDARFSPVTDAFLAGFAAGRDVGAALAVVLDGDLVVDLWAGHSDRRKTELWQQDTLCCFFSATKGVTALCVLQAVAEELVTLDEPVAGYWPEFECNGKAAITARQILNHQAGLVGFHSKVAADLLYDPRAFCAEFANESPWWTPGEKHGYHARSFGYLLDEILWRNTGKTVSCWLTDRMSGPLGLDLHIGLNTGDVGRCAQMLPARVKATVADGSDDSIPAGARRMMESLHDLGSATGAAFQNPSLGPGYMNSERFRTAEMPSMNGHGTARSMAALYDAIPDLIPAAVLRDATATQSSGFDEVLQSASHFGLGFMLFDESSPIGLRPGTYGHAGAGGSMAFYDPTSRIGFCFVMNQMQQGVVTGGTSAFECAEAVYQCL